MLSGSLSLTVATPLPGQLNSLEVDKSKTMKDPKRLELLASLACIVKPRNGVPSGLAKVTKININLIKVIQARRSMLIALTIVIHVSHVITIVPVV